MWLPPILAGGVLILLGIAAVWIIIRAARTHGFIWGLKRLLGVAALTGIVVGSAALWVWQRMSIPRHLTIERIQGSYSAPLEELRRIAREQELDGLTSWGSDKKPPWERLEDQLKTLRGPPEILEASILVPPNRVIPAYHQSDLVGGHAHWTRDEDSQADLVRGWYQQSFWSSLHTLEYFENVEDRSGRTVQLWLTLRLDALPEAP